MTTVLTALLLTIMALAVLWVAAFGGAGAAIAAYRGRDRVGGFLLGALLGPIGLVWLSRRQKGHVAIPSAAPKPPPTSAPAPSAGTSSSPPSALDFNI